MSSGVTILIFILILGTLYFAFVGQKAEDFAQSPVATSTATSTLSRMAKWHRILFPYKYITTSSPVGVAISPETRKVAVVPKAPDVPLGPNYAQEALSKPTPQPPSGFTVKQLSPYYEQVRIASVNQSTSFFSAPSVTLRGDSYGLKENIPIIGWRVKSNTGEVIVPKAVSDLDPTGFSQEGDVVLVPGGSVSVYWGVSPVSRNFRLNKCTGYLNNAYQFAPTLPNECPSIDRRDIVGFTGRCQSFLLSLSTCSVPRDIDKASFSGRGEESCRAFLDTLTYSSCYAKHRSKSDFFSRDWRVWLGGTAPLDPRHDRVLLLDGQGLLVDEYIY